MSDNSSYGRRLRGDEALAGEIKAAFNRRFLDPDTNNFVTGSQTANALPLAMGPVPDRFRLPNESTESGTPAPRAARTRQFRGSAILWGAPQASRSGPASGCYRFRLTGRPTTDAEATLGRA